MTMKKKKEGDEEEEEEGDMIEFKIIGINMLQLLLMPIKTFIYSQLQKFKIYY